MTYVVNKQQQKALKERERESSKKFNIVTVKKEAKVKCDEIHCKTNLIPLG
jgi:hypothetical protein